MVGGISRHHSLHHLPTILMRSYQMAALLLAINFLAPVVSAAPVTTLEADILAADGDITTLRNQLAPSWSTTSPIRSTANILWTALVTLFVCVYTVIHVNIPPPGESWWKIYRRKALWAVAAILAPEYALWAAYEQWKVAESLRNDLKKYIKNDIKEGEEQRKPPSEDFGLIFCFYVTMGGLTIDMSPIQPGMNQMTITPAGIRLLAEYDRLPPIPKKTIKDKSKSDGVAKIIVCLQVTWLIIQSIGRAVHGLPIALLEVHVLAHVACALVLYVIWFKKPHNVREATLVNPGTFSDELTLVLLYNLAGKTQRKEWHTAYVKDKKLKARDWLGYLGRVEDKWSTETSEKAERATEKILATREQAMGVDDPLLDKMLRLVSHSAELLTSRARDVPALHIYFRHHISDWTIFHRSTHEKLFMFVAIVFLTAAYAAIHLAAWRYHFPSEAEMWLWRVSGLVVAGVIPAVTILCIIPFIPALIAIVIFDVDSDVVETYFLFPALYVIFSLFTVVYVGARLFLFIEAFISVRQMPIGVFVTLVWTDYIPHV